MPVKLTYVLLIVFFVAAIAWGLVSYNSLLKARSELNLAAELASALRTEIGTLETNLERTEEDLASVREELSSVQQELSTAESTISSLESQLALYKATWGSVYSDVEPPFQGADIINYGTATNPTWAELTDFLLSDKTDRNVYVPGVYMCGDFARDVHNNAERAGIRAAYVVVELPGAYHSLNAFKTRDSGLIFVDCTGLQLGEPGPSNRDKVVYVRMGRSYVPKSLLPEPGWSATWENMGTVRDVQIYW